jgi:hypothetical protein
MGDSYEGLTDDSVYPSGCYQKWIAGASTGEVYFNRDSTSSCGINGQPCLCRSSWASAWSLSGNQGTAWVESISDFSTNVTQIRFVGISGPTWQSMMAIDDVAIYVQPSSAPTPLPSISVLPSPNPTITPRPTTSPLPTSVPTAVPTRIPTFVPTPIPSQEPSTSPTGMPSMAPSPHPSVSPAPTHTPTMQPTAMPSTAAPSSPPTPLPSLAAYPDCDFASGTCSFSNTGSYSWSRGLTTPSGSTVRTNVGSAFFFNCFSELTRI